MDALVLVGRAAKDRRECGMDGALAQRPAQHIGRRRDPVVQVGLHGLVILLEAGVDQLGAIACHLRQEIAVAGHVNIQLVGEIRGHIEALPLGILVIRVPDQGLHLHQVDHALEIVFRADGNLDRQGARAQALLDHVDAAHEVGAAAIHLVYVAETGNAVVVGEPPIRLGLRLHAGDTVEYHDGAVEHAQRAVHLDREINVPGSVDEVDFLVAPEGGHRGALNGDAALLFLLQVIGGRRGLQILGIVNVDDGVLAPGVVEDPLGRRRLAGIDVSDDADVADIRKRCCAGHSKIP